MNEDYQMSTPSGRGQIVHIRSLKNTSVHTLLKKALQLSELDSQNLLSLGAIYHNFKRVHTNQEVYPQDILRVHQDPLRFNVNFDWKCRIVDNNSSFVVVDKPAHLPTHATLDNSVENLKSQLELFLQTKLFTTHRLDVLTSGLILFAKTSPYLSYFNRLLKTHQVTKIYTAKTKIPPLTGYYIHYMEPSNYCPKKISGQHAPGWLQCELEVLPSGQIRLITGRTHQIRSQLAFLGHPLVGDKLYGGSDGTFDLRCVQLSFDCALTQQKYYYKL
jgi:23S rRNA pseudouridine1911/1915/1917 synthase